MLHLTKSLLHWSYYCTCGIYPCKRPHLLSTTLA